MEAASPTARLQLMVTGPSLGTRDSLGTAGVSPSKGQHPPVHTPEFPEHEKLGALLCVPGTLDRLVPPTDGLTILFRLTVAFLNLLELSSLYWLPYFVLVFS